jgi:pyrophosphate--fructose-6-phosphate 1-phosphotransferase
VALDSLNPGEWFAKQFTDRLEAEKTLVQKSGYFGRSAAPNKQDLELIKASGKLGAKLALDGQCGVVGMDEEKNGELGLIDFERIKGGKPFNIDQKWFNELLKEIGQPK